MSTHEEKKTQQIVSNDDTKIMDKRNMTNTPKIHDNSFVYTKHVRVVAVVDDSCSQKLKYVSFVSYDCQSLTGSLTVDKNERHTFFRVPSKFRLFSDGASETKINYFLLELDLFEDFGTCISVNQL